MSSTDHPPQRKLFGRRKGFKPSARQLFLRENLLPKYALDLEHMTRPDAVFDVSVAEVWLEIGFGAGEHLLEMAQNHPEVGLIGAEAYQSGTDKLLSKIDDLEHKPGNIRIFEGDGRDIIEALPDGSLSRFFLLFPDPWPKRRHASRRFIQMDILDLLASKLRSGALLRVASDDATYAAWTLERLMAHPAFEWTAKGPGDWRQRPPDWPQTRYETKALHGPPVFLQFERI